MPRYVALFSIAFINFTHIIDSMLIMPLGDVFIAAFDINAQQYSFLVSSYALGATLTSVGAFFYMDRFDRKTSLVILYAGFTLGTTLCGMVNTYWLLMGLRFLTGAFGGVIGALAFAIAADLYPFKERGRAMGILVGAFSAASALGVPFGLYLAVLHSWRTPFLVLGAIGLVLLVCIIRFFPSMTSHLSQTHEKPTFSRTIHQLVSDRNQLFALLLGAVLILGHFMIIPFISPSLIRNVGFSQMDITKIFFFGGLAMVFTAPLVGKATDRYGVIPVFTVFILLSIIPTIAITHMSPQPIYYALLFTTLFFITGSGRMIPANTLITASVGNDTRGSFMSMKSALQQLAIALASLISGSVVVINSDGRYDGYPLVGYMSILFCLICLYLIRFLRVAEGN